MRLLHSTFSTVVPTNADYRQILDSVKEEDLLEIVNRISIPRHFEFNAKNNADVGDWIFSQLKSFGYDTYFQGTYSNVVALKRNLTSSPVILIGAHYDSVPHYPGADDNASAVAALLVCAKLIMEFVPHIPVCFGAFNCEEDGLVGSRDFVSSYLPDSNITIDQVHILEMIGCSTEEPNSQSVPARLPIKVPTTGNFLGVVGNSNSRDLIDDLLALGKSYLPNLPVVGLKLYLGVEKIVPDLGRSDHTPFWEKNIPALMWTDTSEFRNPHYHKITDTPDTLNYPFLKNITQMLPLQILNYQNKHKPSGR